MVPKVQLETKALGILPAKPFDSRPLWPDVDSLNGQQFRAESFREPSAHSLTGKQQGQQNRAITSFWSRDTEFLAARDQGAPTFCKE